MKKTLCRVSAVFLLVLLYLTLLPTAAFAADSIDVAVPVTVKVTGAAPSPDETYTVRLERLSADAPMPTAGTDHEDLTVTGADQKAFPAITFTRVGEYCYKVTQLAGQNSKGHYDSTVYYVRITIANAKEGDGFESYVSAHKDEAMQAEKQDIEFVNLYDADPVTPTPTPAPATPKESLTVRKEWSGRSTSRPSSVTIQLMDGKNVAETITLGDWNDWTYTWRDLEKEGHDWNAFEVNVPKGYRADYRYSGDTVIIRNTETLIQTGQLNWPVPVMGGTGSLLMLSGLVMLTKKRKSDDA